MNTEKHHAEKRFVSSKWISCPEKTGFMGENYTVDLDTRVISAAQGFCIGVRGDSCLMLQINTEMVPGKILLRPHIRENGRWCAYEGGERELPVYDITEAAHGISDGIVHERIEVRGREIKLYFGADENTLSLAAEYTNETTVPFSNYAIRQYGEAAMYGNITVRDENGNIVVSDVFDRGDLSRGADSFPSLLNDIDDGGMLTVRRMWGIGEIIIKRRVNDSLPVFRREFTAKEGLVSAMLYTSGLGVYESYINGERVGEKTESGGRIYDELKPGFTEMSKLKFYNAYDVTDMLSGGENVLSAVSSMSWWGDAVAANYGRSSAYLAELVMRYEDGTDCTVATDTDGSWRCGNFSRIADASIFGGESCDARVDESWMKAGFDVSDWMHPEENSEFEGRIEEWRGSRIRVRRDLERKPRSVKIYRGVSGADEEKREFGVINVIREQDNPTDSFVLKPGEVALIDFGQNAAGWERFTSETVSGCVITVRHGEMLNDSRGALSRGNDGPEGSIYNANYRSAAAKTTYISDGVKRSYHPMFTFYGFRYIELRCTETTRFSDVAGEVVTSSERDTGFIETTDECVNRLISNARWGMYSNYLSIPTDCPQRDERQGWTADTQVFTKAGCYLADSESFLAKFTEDMRDAQRKDGAYPGTAPTGGCGGAGFGGTGWADAGIIIPYTLYRMYGGTDIIKENLASMKLYVDSFLGGSNKHGPANIWGDWLAYESNDGEIQDILASSFYAWDALMMAEMTDAVGERSEAERYRRLYEDEKAYYIEKYVRENGELVRGEQSVCLYALMLDLLPDDGSRAAVKKQLTDNIAARGDRLGTGFLGTAVLLPTLTKLGLAETAYTLLLQHENPSWLYSVDQGATTIWERWNSYTKKDGFGDVAMNSFNHYAYGSVIGWMFETMAGISPAEPGFKKILIAPEPDRRIGVKASYDSVRGTIKAESKITDGVWVYECTLPENTAAEIRLPVRSWNRFTVNGTNVRNVETASDGITLRARGDYLVFDALPGTYRFELK